MISRTKKWQKLSTIKQDLAASNYQISWKHLSKSDSEINLLSNRLRTSTMDIAAMQSTSRRGVHRELPKTMRTLLPKPNEAGDPMWQRTQKPNDDTHKSSDDTHRTLVKIKRIPEGNEAFNEGSNEGIWIHIERIPKEEDQMKDVNSKHMPTRRTHITTKCSTAKRGRRRQASSSQHITLDITLDRDETGSNQSDGVIEVVKRAGLRKARKKQLPEGRNQPKRFGKHVKIRETNSQLQQQPIVRMTRLSSAVNQKKPQHLPMRTRGQKRKADNPDVEVSPNFDSDPTKETVLKRSSAVCDTQSVNKFSKPVPGKKKAILDEKSKKQEMDSAPSTVHLTVNQDTLDKWQALAKGHQFSDSELAEFFVNECSQRISKQKDMHMRPTISFATTRDTYSKWQALVQQNDCTDSELARCFVNELCPLSLRKMLPTPSISISPSADTYNKWQKNAQERDCTDSELAAFLLKFYEENTKGTPCDRCKVLMSRYWYCTKCYTLIDVQHKDSQPVDSKATNPEPRQQQEAKDLPDPDSYSSKVPVSTAPRPSLSQEQHSDSDLEDNDTHDEPEEISRDDPANHVDYTSVLHELVDTDPQPVFLREEEQVVASVSDQHKCQVCDRTFTDPAELSVHVKNAQHGTKDDPLHCKLCDKTFVDPDQFTYHLAKHRSDMHHECSICQARFFKAEILVLHAKFHEEDTQFYCDQCNAVFLTKRALSLHQQWQVCEEKLALQQRSQPNDLPGLEQFGNDVNVGKDDFGFLNSETLVEETFTARSKQTRKRRYFPKRDKWQCRQCGASFVTGRQLERHSSVHSGVKKYGCQICGASFPQNCSLVAHMKSHSNFKPYECGECHKTFKYPRFLRIHNCKPEGNSPAKSAQKGESNKTDGKESQTPESAANSKPAKNNSTEIHQPPLSVSTCSSQDISVQQSAQAVLIEHPVKSESGNGNKSVSHFALPSVGSLNDSSVSETSNQDDQLQLPVTSKKAHGANVQNTTLPSATSHKSDKVFSKSSVSKPKRPYQCSYCKACFHFPSHLSQHMHRHTGKNAFHCAECDQSFKFIYSYTRHMNEHKELGPGVPLRSGPRLPNIPRIDRAGFITHENMRIKPLAKTHPDQRALYQCPYCEKQTTRYQLVQHLRVHTGEKPFTCEVCGKSFTRMETYRKHRVIHNSDKPYMCPECGKCFLTKSYLTQHVKSHTNKVLRPFICEYCKKSYHSGRYLKEHIMVVHAGQRQGRSQQFSHTVCEICGKSVTRPYLKIHMRTHSGEKPYLCGSCPACFVSSTQLKVHQRRRHTGEKPYQCEICGKRFVQSFERRYHYRRHHKSQTTSPAIVFYAS